jgi:hypothetical protein
MEWLKKRNRYTHENLLKLRLSEPSDFQNFLRLDATSFDELLKKVKSRIEKWITNMRDDISPSQRLSITLLSIFAKQLFVLFFFLFLLL